MPLDHRGRLIERGLSFRVLPHQIEVMLVSGSGRSPFFVADRRLKLLVHGLALTQ